MDYDERDLDETFAIPDLWAPSRVHLRGIENSGILFSQLHLDDIDLPLLEVSEPADVHEDYFKIPDLSLGATLNVEKPDEEKIQPAPPSETTEEPLNYDDIWLPPYEAPIQEANYQSWDAFESRQTFKERQTPYITETGPLTFNAALVDEMDFLHVNNTCHAVVKAKTYVQSLLALGLGRSSVFFVWDNEKQCFTQALPEMRISGYTGDSLNDLVAMFLECGNITRSLQKFVHKSYSKNDSPARIALADAVSTLLATIQARLSANTSMQNSILQLQALFQPTHLILRCFQQMVSNVSITRNDESMLSTIYQEIQLLEHKTDSLRGILLEILSRVSQPWLKFSSEWLGLQRETVLSLAKIGPGKSFVKVESKEWVDAKGMEIHEPSFVLDIDKVPTFITPENVRAMFEVGRSLRFLRDHHSDHPLARADVIASASPPTLEWKFSWGDVVKIETKALQYEKNLLGAIQRFSNSDSKHSEHNGLPAPADIEEQAQFSFFGKPEADMQACLLTSIDMFDSLPGADFQIDRLSAGLNKFLIATAESCGEKDTKFSPPISLVPLLSFNPIISAQARIVNGTCMRMFFNYHNLRQHLDLQRSFQLLGNGVFSSRLSHALFDPELETAVRQQGIARSGGAMGLRLGRRDTWPPASSELRLALMGVLTESYIDPNAKEKSHAGTFLDQSSMPGNMSFAVRDMTEEEIDKCMDPDSVEALDFLRLTYKPPAPLDAVITPMILCKYDQIFKLLLRVTRMLYVVSALFRDATDRASFSQGFDHIGQRFRIEAHHFISSVGGYFFDTGIETTWRIFQRKLDQIERRIDTDDDNITLGQNEGIDKLRDYHERVLDRIMFALLLRKRQQPVLKLLEEIFALTLQFFKHSRQRALELQKPGVQDEEVRDMYMKFRKKIGVFIAVCRSLSEKKGYGERKFAEGRGAASEGLFDFDDLAEENTVSQLLSRLEMSNYYSRTSNT